MPKPVRTRLIVAAVLGLACGVVSWLNTKSPGFGMQDFRSWWLAARAVLAGHDPYVEVARTFSSGFLYPLPTALATIPLAPLPDGVAGGVFAGFSAGVLAFVVTRDNWWPLLVFLSGSLLEAVLMGHWDILLTAALFAPALTWLGIFKPNVGLGLIAAHPSWRQAVVAGLIGVAALAVMPRWPVEWLATARASAMHFAPYRVGGGLALLLVWLRWREPDARLLGVLSIVPSSPIPYEALPLFAIPRRRWEMVTLVLLSDAFVWYIDVRADTHNAAQYFAVAAPAMTWGMYAPCAAFILWRAVRDWQRKPDTIPPAASTKARTSADPASEESAELEG